MVRLRAVGSWSTLFIAAALSFGLARAQAPSVASNLTGQGIALQLGESLQSLQTAIGALDPSQLHVPTGEKQALTDGQASLMRNLTQAMPGLLQAFRAAPENLGAAFRLYQDADAVLAVAQRSAAVLPAKDDDDDGGVALRSATDELRQSLDQLGSWIEVHGSADYAAHHPSASTHLAVPRPSPAPPPATLVIQDANTTAKPVKKLPAKKKQPPVIPHR